MKRFSIVIILSLIASSTSFSQNPNSAEVFDPTDGLIAYYPFNGNANDETGKSANGIVIDAVLVDDRNGVTNSAFEFDGIDDYIRIDHTSFDRTKSYTISLWFKSNDIQKASELFVLGGNGHFFLQMRDGILGFNTFLNGSSTPSDFDDVKLNVWYHAVGTYDRQTGKQILYVNGLKVAEDNYGQYDSYQPNSSYSSIGSYYYPFVKRNFSGSIDDVRIYNRALSNEEVGALYEIEKIDQNNEENGGGDKIPNYVSTNNLIGWWPLNGSADDMTEFGNDGIINGPILVQDRFGNPNSAYYFTHSGASFGNDHQSIYIPFSSEHSTKEYSISIWVKPESYGWTGNSIIRTDIVSKRERSNITGQASFSIGFRESSSFGILTPCSVHADALELNEWAHLVSTYNGQTLSIYVNGILMAKEDCSSSNNESSTSGIMLGQNWQYNGYWYYLQGALDEFGYWGRALTDQEIKALFKAEVVSGVSITDTYARVLESSTVSVYTSSIIEPSDSLSSFQFEIPIPSGLEFVSATSLGTLSEDGILVHNTVNDTLRVSFASSNYVSGDSTLVKLTFKGVEIGSYELTLINLFLNSQKFDETKSGLFTVVDIIKGDVDGDGRILAYDASIVLHYSVGKDPIPSIDPLPWAPWRVMAADVDQDGLVLAIDASLILKKTVGLIDVFPTNQPDELPVAIDIKFEEGYLIFSSEEAGLYGFNVKLPFKSGVEYQSAEYLSSNIITSDYHAESSYNVAIASAESIIGEFLRIPINVDNLEEVSFDYYSNASKINVDIVLLSYIQDEIVTSFKLEQNYPNPFNPSTQIRFAIPERAHVNLAVYNMLGQRVKTLVNETRSEGWHDVTFDASGLSSGLYIYRLEADGYVETKSMMFVK